MRKLMLLAGSVLLAGCGAADEAATNNADANVTNEAANLADEAMAASEDALVAGTDYNAIGKFPCGTVGSISNDCEMGVKRAWGEDGTILVDVIKPDGMKRAIFFDKNGKAFSADSAEADGSAGWDFKASRDEDWTVIEFGPERYRVPDMLVLGG